MKYKKFENWMIGRSVKEISTQGDCGVIDSAQLGCTDRVYVNWTTGSCSGLRLNISLEDIEFIENPKDSSSYDILKSLLDEVVQIRKLLEQR